ncbi:MAG: hypothetical protein NT005_02940 [Spirochaetes bacterium]|nr:hypothetical protein [Spirochaetota bacterium]
MDKSQFFRLATTLVADDSFPDSIIGVRANLIDSIFLDSSNQDRTAREVRQFCESASAVTLSIEEIEESLSDQAHYEKKFDRSESRYRIRSERFLTLSAQVKCRNLDFYIIEFGQLGDIKNEFKLNPQEIRSILYKFLYYVMNNNLLDFQKVADNSLRALPETPVGQLFSENERKLINLFLQWDNPEKNRLVFKASNLGLEYCILSNMNNYNLMESLGISKKTFYLDTNIVFRALGINGPRRQEMVRLFLKKCQTSGQIIKVSRFTNSEFRESVEYHVNHIQEYSNVNPGLFVEYSAQEDIYNYYYSWKRRNSALGISSFKAYVIEEYEDLLAAFNIVIDEKLPYNQEDRDIQQSVHHYSRSIDQYKRDAPKQALAYDFYVPDKAVFDAKNIILVEEIRQTSTKPYSSIECFLVSTDHLLLNWDHGRHNVTPVVMLPTHWLSLMLRFVSRTSDDYRSFVSFINLPRSTEVISNEQLSAVLEGVGQITTQAEMQQDILRRIVDAKMDTILHSRRPSNIIERTKAEATRIRDEEVEALKAAVDDQRKSLSFKSGLLAQRDEESVQTQKVVSELQTTVASFQAYFDKLNLLRAIRRWRRPVWYLLAACGLAVAYVLFQWLGPDTPWNIPLKIAQYIDGLKSFTVQAFFTSLNYAVPAAVLGWSGKVFYSKFFSEKARTKFLKSMSFPNAVEKSSKSATL